MEGNVGTGLKNHVDLSPSLYVIINLINHIMCIYVYEIKVTIQDPLREGGERVSMAQVVKPLSH